MSNDRKVQHLVKGWCWSTVNEALRNHDYARVPVKAEDRASRSGEYSYYGASGVIDTIDDYLFDGTYLLIGEDGANLLARSKPIAFQAHGKFWVNNHAHVLTTYGDMPNGYFESYFNFIDLAPHVTGTAQPKLPQAAMNKIAVPIAPCAEQRRIVGAIESYFTRLDDAVTTLERVERDLKRYRASVLKSAVEGRLVSTEAAMAKQEGRDYEPASVLLERILSERRRRWSESGKKGTYQEPSPPDTTNLPDLPEGWCWASVDQVGDVSGGVTKNAKRDDLSRTLPYLRVANVYANQLRLDEIKEIGVTEQEIERVLLQRHDLLVVEGNGSLDQIGRVALWDGSINPCVHQNHLIKIRFDDNSLPEWALTWLLSPGGRQSIQQVASSTSGLHTLSISKVARLPLPLCPQPEGVRISDEIARAASLLEAAEKSTQLNSRRCTRLRQSILKWAFEGKLADQDPADEPASVLLERIKAEREHVQPVEPAKVTRQKRGAAKKQVRA